MLQGDQFPAGAPVPPAGGRQAFSRCVPSLKAWNGDQFAPRDQMSFFCPFAARQLRILLSAARIRGSSLGPAAPFVVE